MKSKPKCNRDIPTASARLPDGRLIELVYDREQGATGFAMSDDGDVTFVDAVDLPTGGRLVPIAAENNLIRHHVVMLPARPVAFESVATLTAEIEVHLSRYVDLSPSFLKIASTYILLSWVYDAFNELPYLRLRGEPGSGKTRALIAIGSLCYKAFFASGASTVSPIFHSLDMFRGTLIFDEADFRFSDEKAELIKIFNNGNVRGFPVLRASMLPKREFDPQAFMVFGPKIVAMRHAFADPALESRFITEEMGQRPLRSDIPINLPDIQEAEAEQLRNKLLHYRFQYLDGLAINPLLADPNLTPRLNQILIPLLSIVEDQGVRGHIVTAANDLDRALKNERAATPEARLLEVLATCLRDTDDLTLPLSVITQVFTMQFGSDFERPVTARYLGSLLRNRLHLVSYKTGGVYVVPVTELPKVEMLSIRYGVTPTKRDA